MKFITFFILIGLFVWIAIIPPNGVNKYPSVNVKFEYAKNDKKLSINMSTDEYVTYEEAINQE